MPPWPTITGRNMCFYIDAGTLLAGAMVLWGMPASSNDPAAEPLLHDRHGSARYLCMSLTAKHIRVVFFRLDAAVAVDHTVDHTVDHEAPAKTHEPIIGQLQPRKSSGSTVRRRNPGPLAPADSHLVEADSLEAEVEAEGMFSLMRQGLEYLCAKEHRYGCHGCGTENMTNTQCGGSVCVAQRL